MQRIILGDCREKLKQFPDNTFDAMITDPPAGISFMGKEWDGDRGGRNKWISWLSGIMKEAYRVLKPGAHILVWSLPRTSHWTGTALEDAGFECRDIIHHVFGCLSEDTEILTLNGWERFHKDIEQSPVLCYDIDKDSFEFAKPKRSFIYENEYPAYRIQSDHTDQIVSRNHRVIVERSGRKVFCYAETLQPQESIPFLESLYDLPEYIPCRDEGTSIKKQDLLQKVWGKTDFQVKSGKTFRKKSRVDSNFLPHMWEKDRDEKKASTVEFKKLLFKILQSKSMLWLFKEILCKWKREKTSREGIVTRKEPCLERRGNLLQDSWELLWSKVCEVSSRVFRYGEKRRLCYGTSSFGGSKTEESPFEIRGSSSYRSRSEKQRYRQSSVISDESRTQKIRRTEAEVTEIEYIGKVWCVETVTGAFVARRNGKIFITGNSGFPKSLNISKAIDKKKGAKREVISTVNYRSAFNCSGTHQAFEGETHSEDIDITVPATEEAKQWDGWGTALKPAVENWWLCRKPISEKTIVDNVLKWGTGALNIDACRIPVNPEVDDMLRETTRGKRQTETWEEGSGFKNETNNLTGVRAEGRFPANLIHDGSEEVEAEFVKAGERKSGNMKAGTVGNKSSDFTYFNKFINQRDTFGDSCSASRFFYCAKPSTAEKNAGCKDLPEKDIGHNRFDTCAACGNYILQNPSRPSKCTCESPVRQNNIIKGNHHPTVKSLSLISYFIKMIVPPGGTVIDPFAGSGTTCIAALELARGFVCIELEEEYFRIMESRLKYHIREINRLSKCKE